MCFCFDDKKSRINYGLQSIKKIYSAQETQIINLPHVLFKKKKLSQNSFISREVNLDTTPRTGVKRVSVSYKAGVENHSNTRSRCLTFSCSTRTPMSGQHG